LPGNLLRSFDSQWYLDEYPDVQLSGLDPYEHYLWLGRRLNRAPVRPEVFDQTAALVSDGHDILGGDASIDARYGDTAIADALERLCDWLLPIAITREGSLNAQDLFQRLRWDFGNTYEGGVMQVRPHTRSLIHMMRDYGGPVDLTCAFDLKPCPQTTDSILLASYYAPTLMHAGGLRLLDTYSLIRERAPDVRLTLFAPRQEAVDGDVSALKDIFDEIHFCRVDQFRPDWLMQQLQPGQRFALADLQFHQAGSMARQFRALARRLIFTPMEALSRFAFDEVRDKALKGELAQSRVFALVHDGAREREIMASVDMTVCVSDADAGFLAQVAGGSRVNYYPTGLSSIEFQRELAPHYTPPPFAGKHNRLVFAAYFGSETNRYGLQWYLENVHPQVLDAVPNYDLAIVGRGDTAELQAFASRNVHFVGEAPNLAPVLEQAKAGLVLALNGSGFRGKINQYAICGLPAISTSLGATGLSYERGKDIMIADGVDAFAQACISMLTDPAKGEALAAAARQRAIDHYSWSGIWPRIEAIYGLGGKDGEMMIAAS
jgi:glycosyltransferase involved in cell wall biosynthesis